MATYNPDGTVQVPGQTLSYVNVKGTDGNNAFYQVGADGSYIPVGNSATYKSLTNGSIPSTQITSTGSVSNSNILGANGQANAVQQVQIGANDPLNKGLPEHDVIGADGKTIQVLGLNGADGARQSIINSGQAVAPVGTVADPNANTKTFQGGGTGPIQQGVAAPSQVAANGVSTGNGAGYYKDPNTGAYFQRDASGNTSIVSNPQAINSLNNGSTPYTAESYSTVASSPFDANGGSGTQSGSTPSGGTQSGSSGATYTNNPVTGTSAIQQVINDYNTAYKALGLGDIKSSYNDFVKQQADLATKKAGEIADVNNNPWLSQGVRDRTISQINDKYLTQESILTNKISLLDSLYKQGQAEADTIVSKSEAISAEQAREATAMAQQQADATTALQQALLKSSSPIEVSAGATLYDPTTGKALFTAPSKPTSSGSSSGSTGTTPQLTGKTTSVAGVQVDSSIAGDVQDVLTGLNTLYNIRQSMGRTNAAAAYMASMRAAIQKIDPNFDFVASDAGGKFVSTAFYQKAKTAITSVLPNIDEAINLSNQVSRIGVAGVDKLLQGAAVQVGNQKVSNFHEAQKLIADEIGLALGQGTVSDMKLQLGFDITDPSMKAEVFASNLGIVKDFLNNRVKALDGQRYSSSVTGGTGGGQTSVFDQYANDINPAPNGTDAYIPRSVWASVQDKDGLLAYVKSLGKNLLVQ